MKRINISHSNLWSLCNIEENSLKEKHDVGSNEQVQTFVVMKRRKGKFGKFGPQKNKEINMSQIQCYRCQEYGHYKRDCPSLKKENNK